MLQLFKIEVSRLFSEIKTYLLDNLVGIADDVLICTGILVGVGSDFFPGRSQEYALIGMILWRVTIVSLQTSCGIVQKELRLGTLEQLMLSNYSFLKLLIVRLEAKMLVESCKLFFSTIVIMLMFNIKIYSKINFGLFILVLLVSCIGTFGMGFVVAGIALVYKKAVALVNSISYFILFFYGNFNSVGNASQSFFAYCKGTSVYLGCKHNSGKSIRPQFFTADDFINHLGCFWCGGF